MLWLRYVHVLAVLAFALTHGATAMVLFRLRARRGRLSAEDVRTLLRLSSSTFSWLWRILALLAVAGLGAAVVEGWIAAGRLWPWVAIITLAAIVVFMRFVAAPYVREIRKLVDRMLMPAPGPRAEPLPEKWLTERLRAEREADALVKAAAERPTHEQLSALLGDPRMLLIPAVGIAGGAFMVFLMVLDPF